MELNFWLERVLEYICVKFHFRFFNGIFFSFFFALVNVTFVIILQVEITARIKIMCETVIVCPDSGYALINDRVHMNIAIGRAKPEEIHWINKCVTNSVISSTQQIFLFFVFFKLTYQINFSQFWFYLFSLIFISYIYLEDISKDWSNVSVNNWKYQHRKEITYNHVRSVCNWYVVFFC